MTGFCSSELRIVLKASEDIHTATLAADVNGHTAAGVGYINDLPWASIIRVMLSWRGSAPGVRISNVSPVRI
jgi:hypothetical protein